MSKIVENPLFGIILTVATFAIGTWIFKKYKNPILNPLLLAIILTIAFLLLFKIDYTTYNQGGKLFTMLLAPATVVLAVPLYRQQSTLKKNLVPILVGIFVGSLVVVTFIFLMSKLLQLDNVLLYSLLPKSITTAIGVEVSKQIGGNPAITVFAIVFTGIIGAILAPVLAKLFKSKVAVGAGIGTSAHAAGTAAAIQLGEVQGAISGLSIGIAGVITSIIIPILLTILKP